MYVIIDNRGNYIQVLGYTENKDTAIGMAYNFVVTLCSSDGICDYQLYDIEPKGKEFRIQRRDTLCKVQILEI